MTVVLSKHAEERMAERGVRLEDFETNVKKMAKKISLVGPFSILIDARGGTLKVSIAKGEAGVVIKTVAWKKRPKR